MNSYDGDKLTCDRFIQNIEASLTRPSLKLASAQFAHTVHKHRISLGGERERFYGESLI